MESESQVSCTSSLPLTKHIIVQPPEVVCCRDAAEDAAVETHQDVECLHGGTVVVTRHYTLLLYLLAQTIAVNYMQIWRGGFNFLHENNFWKRKQKNLKVNDPFL